jgi:hypothetical protein
MNRLLLLLFLSLCVYLPTSSAGVENTQISIPCPTTAIEAKKAFAETETPGFSEKCYDSILQHLENGEEDWIKNVQFFSNSGAASFNESIPIAMNKAIVKNPALILQIIYDEGDPDTYKDWCVEPFLEGTPDEITPFDNAAVAALRNAKISPSLEKLRQQCIVSFLQDRDHPFACKLSTPEAIAESVKHDHGERVSSGNDQCGVMLSYQLKELKPEWLAILPILTDPKIDPLFRQYTVLNSLILALPKSPETVLKLLTKYFSQQEFQEACHPILSPPDLETKEDANIKIEPDPYYNPDNYELNVPKAIQTLNQLKPSDPGISKARDTCLKELQKSLQELQRKQQPASWIYHQSTGQLMKNGQQFAIGYAGCGEKARNNPDYQYEDGVDMHIPGDPSICHLGAGPLPTGRYTIGPIGIYSVGENAMPLTPNEENTQTDRKKVFYIRGDNKRHPGYSSDGCIILKNANVRIRMGENVANGKDILEVIP